jgi:hypothetical protein
MSNITSPVACRIAAFRAAGGPLGFRNEHPHPSVPHPVELPNQLRIIALLEHHDLEILVLLPPQDPDQLLQSRGPPKGTNNDGNAHVGVCIRFL